MKGSLAAAAVALVLFGQLGDPPDPPAAINYQGTLKQADGSDLPNGVYVLEFRIYDGAGAGATVVWGKEYEVVLSGGRFNVILGDAAGNVLADAPGDVSVLDAFNGSDRFLGITVAARVNGGGRTPIEGASEIGPRQQMLSAPFAVNALNATSTQNIVPPGTIVPFAGTTAPPGWLLCDGGILDATVDPNLANLFAAIGTTWGGTGEDAFVVPDLRGRTLVGAGGTLLTTSDNTLGATGGEENVTLTVAQMPAHTHSYNDGRRGTEEVAAAQSCCNNIGGSSFSDPTRTSGSTGGGAAHNNMPPYAAVNYIIKL